MLLAKLPKTNLIDLIVSCNERSRQYNLTLSKSDALEIIKARDKCLEQTGRIELGCDTVRQIINAFCDSPYINQNTYVSTICDLIEIFYHSKTATWDKISDDELIQIMRFLFNNRCFGSIELLSGRELDKLIQEIRYGRDIRLNMEEYEV